MELKISPVVEKYLYAIALNDNTLFNADNLNLNYNDIVIPKRISKKIKVNLDKIKDELPAGIYTSISNVKNIISKTLKSTVIDATSYSPLVVEYPDFNCCKTMKYRFGNIITDRDKEIEDILLSFTKSNKRGVILTGEAGTGKSSVVKAVNNRLIERNVPRQLNGCYILNLDVPYVFAKYKEDPIGTIIKVLERASENDKVILFIDEVHQLLGHKMNDIMKPYLTEKIRFIGATTIDEYHAIITDDRALERRFTVIPIDEPNIHRTIKMITGTKSVLEEYHKCIIPKDVCEYAVINGSRFLGHRKNPDKSLDVVDIACSIMYEKEIIRGELPSHVESFSLENIEHRKQEIQDLREFAGDRILTTDYINQAISSITGISYGEIKNSLNCKSVAKNISDKVFGQDEQIKSIANVVNIFKYTKADRTQPISVLLVVGPPGVGKTTACKELARNLYGKDKYFIDYDMSGLSSEFMLTELKGAPPGYVGYSKSGRLIKQIRNNSQSIIYFRGINKSHETIQEYIIDACRRGKMMDSAEREASLNNAVIVYAVTLTNEEYEQVFNYKKKTMGFSKTEEPEDTFDKKALETIVGKELVKAAEEMVVFKPLSSDVLERIFDLNVKDHLDMYNINVDFSELKTKVLTDSKNGRDVISKLSSEVPKIVFQTFKQQEY